MTQFYENVKKYFSFLADEFGFHILETNDYKVVWQKERFRISIYFDVRRSYELDIRYGYYGSDAPEDSRFEHDNSFDLYEILQYARLTVDSCFFQASSATEFAEPLERMANLFHVICRKIDLFLPEAFDALIEIRDKNCLIYARQKEQQKLEVLGNEFWKSKNYSSLIQLYEIHAEILTPLEKKRLDYARKKHRESTISLLRVARPLSENGESEFPTEPK